METIKIIIKILRTFEENMDFEGDILKKVSHEGLGISEKRFIRILEIMSDGELIKGANVNAMSNAVYFSDPRITFKGLEYLCEKSFIALIDKSC